MGRGLKEASGSGISIGSGVSQPIIVGREKEIEFLKRRLTQASTGKGSLVLLVGEAGIGKSRLAEEFGRIAAESGIHVAVGRCIPGAPVPFLPFREAFEGVEREVGVSHHETGLIGWLRGPRERQETIGVLASQNESTLRSVLKFLKDLSNRFVLLIILEDLQWSDSASIQLLHFIARNLEGLKTLVVATYRPEELTAGEREIHPLLEALRLMRLEGICHELTLGPLSIEGLGLAVKSMLGGSLDRELLWRVAEESEGNPLFVVETVHTLVQSGYISLKSGAWAADSQVRVEIPSTVREVILRRLERLPKNERRLLDCAAIVGERFDPTLLEKVLKLNRLSVLETLSSIERDTRLIAAGDEFYRFGHEKVQRVLYEQISTPLRRELHKAIAQILERKIPIENLYGSLSYHYFQAAVSSQCTQYSLLAGQDCLRRFALPDAAEYFERVITIAKDDTSLLKERGQALEGAGDANVGLGRTDSARSHYEDFLKEPRSSTDKARVLRKLAESTDRITKRQELVRQAESCEGIETVEIGRIKRLRGEIAAYARRWDEAKRLYSEAEDIFKQRSPTIDLARTLILEAEVLQAQGLVTEALQKSEEATRIYSGTMNLEGEIRSLIDWGKLCFHAGLTNEAIEKLTKAYEIGESLKNYATMAEALFWKGIAYYITDQFELSTLQEEKASTYSQKTEDRLGQFFPKSILTLASLKLGRLKEAEKLLEENRQLKDSIGPPSTPDAARFWNYRLYFDEAELFAAKREWVLCNEKFREFLENWRGLTIYNEIMRGMVSTRFGEALVKQGLRDDAKEQFRRAIKIFEAVGNTPQAKKVEKLLNELD